MSLNVAKPSTPVTTLTPAQVTSAPARGRSVSASKTCTVKSPVLIIGGFGSRCTGNVMESSSREFFATTRSVADSVRALSTFPTAKITVELEGYPRYSEVIHIREGTNFRTVRLSETSPPPAKPWPMAPLVLALVVVITAVGGVILIGKKKGWWLR